MSGECVIDWNPARSREAGIETVFQDRALAVQQSIVRNIFMGRELGRPVRLSQDLRSSERGRTADARDRLYVEGFLAATRLSGSFRAASGRASPLLAPSSRTRTSSCSTSPRRRCRLPRPPRCSTSCARFVRRAALSSSSATTSTTSYDIAERFVVIDRGHSGHGKRRPRSLPPRS